MLGTAAAEKKTRSRSKTYPVEFDVFYALYPRHSHKFTGLRAYNEQIAKGYSHDEILAGVRAFRQLVAQRGTDNAFIPHPATWLRAGAWLDDDLRVFVLAVDAGRQVGACGCPGKYRALKAYLLDCKFEGDTLTVPNQARKSMIETKFGAVFPELRVEVAIHNARKSG